MRLILLFCVFPLFALEILTFNSYLIPFPFNLFKNHQSRINSLPKLIKKYDLITLQEVYHRKDRYFLENNWEGYSFNPDHKIKSNGTPLLFSKYPIKEKKFIAFKNTNGIYGHKKGAIIAKIMHPRPFRVVALHLSAGQNKEKERLLQLENIKKALRGNKLPIIFMGDFNISHLSDEYFKLLDFFSLDDLSPRVYTYDSHINPWAKIYRSKIDHIFLKGFKEEGEERVLKWKNPSNRETYFSDHFALWKKVSY